MFRHELFLFDGARSLPTMEAMRRTLIILLLLAQSACSGPSRPAPTRRRFVDPSLATLDRVLAARPRGSHGGVDRATDPAACMRQAPGPELCPVPRGTRVYRLRVALDPRFHRWPDWRGRLASTMDCVNRLYRTSGTSWQVDSIVDWDPGQNRHRLHHLLDRLQLDFPADKKTLVVGIAVWEQRRVYATAGGEIGLSQGGACVVPSWPRVENDCVILAHELGHLVGARHVPGKRWVMGWAARPFHLPAADPIARVVATYRFHPRNVDAMRIHHRARLTHHGLRLPPDCRQRVRQLNRCWHLR